MTTETRHEQQRGRVLRRFRASGAARLVGLASAASIITVGASASAQTDVTPPLPNVLILLDTSGSMERMPSGALPLKDDGTTLTPGTVATLAHNRWVSALEVLGGNIQNYKVVAVDRASVDYQSEFGLGGQNPYDTDYNLYHYRPISNDCAIGSNALTKNATWPNAWASWGLADFGWRKWGGAALGAIGTCTSSDFKTDGLGILDTFRDQARFGLMTFDTATGAQTGWTGSAHDYPGGMAGLWSYFPGWKGAGTYLPQYGWPAACPIDSTTLKDHVYENGARNPSAPPWEGPLIQFAADDSTSSLRAVNDRIRYSMLATRPFGATPIGPMLQDAQYYMWNDPDGPTTVDPLISCRGNFIILITDGFPNEDLRDGSTASTKCEDNVDPKSASVWNGIGTCKNPGAGGCCPSRRAADVAYELANPPAGKPKVETFVVGFSLTDSAGAAVDCTDAAVDPVKGSCGKTGGVLPGDPRYPCCTLHEIAYNGSNNTNKAYIADSADSLRGALVKAMAAATATTSTSRTLPVFAAVASGSSATSTQFEFRSSFKVNPFTAWTGTLERIRYQCLKPSGGPLAPQKIPFSATEGDDLGSLIATASGRNFFTWNGVDAATKNTSTTSIRRYITSADNDGVSSVAGVSIEGSGSSFTGTSTLPSVMGITATSCADEPDPSVCKLKYLNYALGLPAARATWLDRVGLAFGDIYHATPVGMSAPDAFLRDESYTDFRRVQATRTPMLLVATNDGMLHGIQTNRTDTTNPELWAFIPPAVMPSLSKQYDGAHALLLDMAPVVKDVAFGPTGTAAPPWGRTRDQAKGGQARWRSIAVGGLTTGRGYYALDVTDPTRPEFLWQLTTIKDATGGDRNLFGQLPAIPEIGTVYYAEPGQAPVETPVAFLAGGEGTLDQVWPTQCNRWSTAWGVGERSQTRCWRGAGNSFTVVRLYDGKILRTFRNDPLGKAPTHPAETDSPVTAFQSAGVAATVVGTYANIDAPLTGAVAIYPADTGTVTSRAFVGDEDGDLWKADFSDTDPTKWSFSLFHDAYTGVTFGSTSQPPQPVAVAPVVTVDRLGRITVVYSTGDQANFSALNSNHMWSVSEVITPTSPVPTVSTLANWHIPFTGGITPTGPLSLFSGSLFFSTFTPDVASDSACLTGQGTLWGVDYVEVEPGTTFPRGRLQQQSGETVAGSCPSGLPNQDGRAAFSSFFRCLPLDPGTIVFGAGVTQRPTCIDTAATATTDPYTGATSTHSNVTGVTPGSFELVAQTGPKATSKGSSAGDGTTTKTFTRTLVAPVSITKIDSWAAIVE